MKLPRLFNPKWERAPFPVDQEGTLRIMYEMEEHTLVAFAQKYPLTPAHFSFEPDGSWSALHKAAFQGHLDQIIEVLQRSGQGFTCDDFLKDPRTLAAATAWHHLDQVFSPALWAGRIGEMEKLSKHVAAEELKKIGYEKLREEAMLLSVRSGAADFAQARRPAPIRAAEERASQSQERA